MPRRRPRVPDKSTLIVVEGDGEKAFCSYLKTLVKESGKRYKIENARGGSPDKQVDHLKQLCIGVDYDHLVLVMDSDLEMTKRQKDWLRKKRVNLIQAKPCLEGEWLRLEGKKPNANKEKCQREAARHSNQPSLTELKSKLTDPRFWERYSLKALQAKRSTHPWLDQLLTVFVGEKEKM